MACVLQLGPPVKTVETAETVLPLEGDPPGEPERHHRVRRPPRILDQFVDKQIRCFRVRTEHDIRMDRLAFHFVGHADHRGFRNGRMAH